MILLLVMPLLLLMLLVHRCGRLRPWVCARIGGHHRHSRRGAHEDWAARLVRPAVVVVMRAVLVVQRRLPDGSRAVNGTDGSQSMGSPLHSCKAWLSGHEVVERRWDARFAP